MECSIVLSCISELLQYFLSIPFILVSKVHRPFAYCTPLPGLHGNIVHCTPLPGLHGVPARAGAVLIATVICRPLTPLQEVEQRSCGDADDGAEIVIIILAH